MKILYTVGVSLISLSILSNCSQTEQKMTLEDPFDDLPKIQLSAPLDISDHDSISNGQFFFQSKYFRDMEISKQGHIFVSNVRGNSIQQFDQDGGFLANIGTEGRGPGEFQTAPLFDILNMDTLYTLNGDSWMVNTFIYSDGEWSYSDSFILEQKKDADPEHIYQLNNNELAIEFTPNFQRLISDNSKSGLKKTIHIVSTDGQNALDSLLAGPMNQKSVYKSDVGATFIQEVPFGTKSIFNPGPDESLYHLVSNNFFIKIYDKEGSFIDSIKHPNFSIEIPADKRRSKVEDVVTASTGSKREDRTMKDYMFEQIPTSAHPLSNMFVDRDTGFIIVKRSEIYNGPNWLLLDPEGNRLGVFDLPESMEVFDFRNGKIVGALMSKETDALPTIRVLSIPQEL